MFSQRKHSAMCGYHMEEASILVMNCAFFGAEVVNLPMSNPRTAHHSVYRTIFKHDIKKGCMLSFTHRLCA